MKIFRGFEDVAPLTRPVIAVGSFDGVHRGHCQILRYLCEAAAERGGQSVVVTFAPHPQVVLNPNSDFFTINTLDRNLELIAEQNVDVAVVLPFTKSFAQTSYLEFVEQYLIGRLHAKALVMGPNHALGHNREGDRFKIETVCQQHHVEVVDIPEFMLHDAQVHSSTIRKLIQNRHFDAVDDMLGYHYEIK
ncbi:MAG: FAD synthetase family protein [Bacteroidales bacterium]|nr:FAD synthetase family protein [Bacteroidales bacterium]